MKLKNLYTRFLSLSDDGRRAFIAGYRRDRYEAIKSHSSVKKGTRLTWNSLGLSQEEMEMAKKLGLKPKDVKALRST